MAGFWKAEWALANDFHFYAYTYGGKIVDKQGNILFNTDPNTLAAVQEMVKMLKEGVVDPASLTYDQEAVNNIFLKGDVAFLSQGIPGIMAYAQDPARSKVIGQVKVGLVPGGKVGTSAALTLPEAYAIPQGLDEQGDRLEVHRVHDQQGNEQEARAADRHPAHLDGAVHRLGPREALSLLGGLLQADGERQGPVRAHVVQQLRGRLHCRDAEDAVRARLTPKDALNEMAALLKDYAGKP